jgi:hypothetical protein
VIKIPFGKWANFEECCKDIRRKNPDYSDEQVRATCGKLKAKLEKCTNPDAAYSAISRDLKKSDAGSVAPMTADIDKKHGKMEITKSWNNELLDILTSPRRAEMTFHIPIVDKDKEIITAGAMEDAISDYVNFPIISEFHKERPIGIAERIWRTKDDEFKALVRIRDDRATDDVWEKVNLPSGTPGRYDQVSIAGKRIVYNDQCNVPQALRRADNPCRTEKLRLDSISVCDDRARNEGTEFNVVKAESEDETTFIYTTALEITKVEDNLIKAETTESELIHPVTDGANQADAARSQGTIVNPLIETGTKKCKKCSKGEKMPKPNGTLEMKKTSDEEKEGEGQEPVEETEAKKGPMKVKKGKASEADPEKQVEKGEEEEEHEEAEGQKGINAKIDRMMSILEKLVASDKKVHATVEKGEPPEESTADKEEEGERKKEARSEESRAHKEEKKEDGVKKADTSAITKAALESEEFQKALTNALGPMQAQINSLTEQVQKLGDEPLYKSGLMITKIKEDGTPEMGNAGALASQRKKSQQKV